MVRIELKRRNIRFFQTGFVVAVLAACTAFQSSAQGVKITRVDDAQAIENDTTVFKIVEVIPEFPGGDEARIKFMVENLNYPKLAREAGVEGRVAIGFIVETDGRLSNFTVIKSVHPLLDEEALRVIKMMPNWIPGKQDGKPVRVQFLIPVSFTLEDGKTTATQKGKKRKK